MNIFFITNVLHICFASQHKFLIFRISPAKNMALTSGIPSNIEKYGLFFLKIYYIHKVKNDRNPKNPPTDRITRFSVGLHC
jgi:hypothetical protein